jgi:hypothetical protein
MHSCKLREGIILSVVAIVVTFTILSFSLVPDRYAYSQSSKTNSTTKAANSGVDLINTHPSPSNVKAGSKFQVISTVVNNSPTMIMFPAGPCDSPLFAHFARNVLTRHTQGCNTASAPFKLNSGKEVTIAGPGSGTIYQAVKAGQTRSTATLYYQTENGQVANVTKSFIFTIS